MTTAELTRIVEGRHHDPHSVLGAHPHGSEVTIRVRRPDAQRIEVKSKGRVVGELKPSRADVLEGAVRTGDLELGPCGYRYELTAHYPGGKQFTFRDPYAFSPTLGELDLHLFAEGKHRRIYDKLGAHVLTRDGVEGTSLAVWAPNAKAVRVVGDFNSWDGRLHPMRSMGSSGVWELFIPGVGAGALYKYELVGENDRLVLKSDPYARRCQHP
ncbi:MAG: 1,4-alpha-glucan branching enzyme, partial [Myxococcales bacterium]|nr:1,4-alpha-glucan branching enzyme [Myxococcales bacterium]